MNLPGGQDFLAHLYQPDQMHAVFGVVAVLPFEVSASLVAPRLPLAESVPLSALGYVVALAVQ